MATETTEKTYKPIGRICWENVPKDWFDDEDEEDEWEEVYNSQDGDSGEVREYCGQPGIFFQTYGNGGGPGGSGGYWVRDGGTAMWKVEGDDFTYLNNYKYEVREQDSESGICAAILVIEPNEDEEYMFEDDESVSTDGCATCDWCNEDMPAGPHLQTGYEGEDLCRVCAKKYNEQVDDIQPASIMCV